MVVVQERGDLIRSLVRVPGSGHNNSLPSQLIDLSKVSPLAYVNDLKLPPILMKNSNQEQNKRENFVVNGPPSQTPTNKPLINQPQPVKRPVNVVIEQTSKTPINNPPINQSQPVQQQSMNLTPASIKVFTQSQIMVLVPLSIYNNTLVNNVNLCNEKNVLTKENLLLKDRIALFHKLFKDRNRLKAVVKRLGVTF